MLTFLLANWRVVLFAALLAAVGIQELRVRSVKAEFLAYQTAIEKQVAENKTKAALETARMAHNAQKAVDDLTTRLTSLDRAYRVLRDRRSTKPVPSLAESTGIAQTCPGEPDKPNPAVGRLESLEAGIESILEAGDREIAKYIELWELQKRNAGQ